MKIDQDQEVAELLNKALIKAIKRYALTAVGMSSMVDELLNITNDQDHTQNNPFNYNLWLKCLDTQLNEPTNQNYIYIKVPKVVKPANKKTLLYIFRD